MIRPLLDPQEVLPNAAERSPLTVLATVTGLHLLHHLAQYPRVATACVVAPWTVAEVWLDCLDRHYADAAHAAQSVSLSLHARRR